VVEKRNDVSRRVAILQSAATLFGRHGYQQTSMQQIADDVGLLKGSLYHHYQSKQEILFEITRGPLEELVQQVTSIAATSMTPRKKVGEAIRSHIASLDRSYPHLMVVTAETDDALPAGIRNDIARLRREYQAVWEAIVAEGLADESFRSPGSAGVLVNLILGSINWMHRWYVPDGALSADEVSAVLSAMVLHGIVPVSEAT
jgi:AcrR family transcriptional regulator